MYLAHAPLGRGLLLLRPSIPLHSTPIFLELLSPKACDAHLWLAARHASRRAAHTVQ